MSWLMMVYELVDGDIWWLISWLMMVNTLFYSMVNKLVDGRLRQENTWGCWIGSLIGWRETIENGGSEPTKLWGYPFLNLPGQPRMWPMGIMGISSHLITQDRHILDNASCPRFLAVIHRCFGRCYPMMIRIISRNQQYAVLATG